MCRDESWGADADGDAPLREGIAAIQKELESSPEFPDDVERAAAQAAASRGCPSWTAPTSRS